MTFLAKAGTGRSGLALRIAAIGAILWVVFVVLFSLRLNGGRVQEPLFVAFGVDAVIFHVGLVVALVGRLGDPAKRGERPVLAIVANGVPAAFYWLFVYALVQALKNFN